MRLPFALAALLMPATAAAQAVAPDAPAPAPAPAPAAALPDIEFDATVHMDSIRFGSAPQAGVRFSGGPRLDTRHDVERDGLPRPAAAGRSYRDVTVRTTISATLLDPALDAAVGLQASPTPPPPTIDDEDSP